MKILCTTDFSEVSINAIDWIFAMLHETKSAEIEIVHCISVSRRSDIFLSIDDLIMETAVEDMKVLTAKYGNLNDNIKVVTSLHKAFTKTFIPRYSTHHKFDLIVTGTTGLTSLKNIFVGSVTDYISTHADIPLLTIPDGCKFTGLQHVVFGLGKEELKNTNNLTFLYHFLKPHDPKVSLLQVLKEDSHTISVDLRLEEHLKDLKYEYVTIEDDHSVNFAINHYCRESKADLLCMMHHQRNWLNSLIHKSITKEKLFTLDRPLFILPN